jgi:hypothetical protein
MQAHLAQRTTVLLKLWQDVIVIGSAKHPAVPMYALLDVILAKGPQIAQFALLGRFQLPKLHLVRLVLLEHIQTLLVLRRVPIATQNMVGAFISQKMV